MKYFILRNWRLLLAGFSIIAWIIMGTIWVFPRTSDRILVYEAKEDYAAAVVLLEEVQSENPLSKREIRQLGGFYLKLSQPEKAEKLFSVALSVSGMEQLGVEIIRFYIRNGDIEQAQRAHRLILLRFQEWIRTDSSSQEARAALNKLNSLFEDLTQIHQPLSGAKTKSLSLEKP